MAANDTPIGALVFVICILCQSYIDLSQPECSVRAGYRGEMGALTLTATIISAGSAGSFSVRVVSGFGLALIAGGALLIFESRGLHPMMPLRFFRIPSFSAATAAGFMNTMAYYGLIFVPLTGTVTFSNILGSHIATRYGPKLPTVAGFLTAAAGYGSLSNLGAHTEYLKIVLPLAAIPFGLGLAIPPMTSALLSSVERRRSGIALAMSPDRSSIRTLEITRPVRSAAAFGHRYRNRLLRQSRVVFAHLTPGPPIRVNALSFAPVGRSWPRWNEPRAPCQDAAPERSLDILSNPLSAAPSELGHSPFFGEFAGFNRKSLFALGK
jgi:hypothetical protein